MQVRREVKPVKESEMPTVLEVLEREMTPGTMLVYPEKEIVFPNSQLSPVKSLKVNITSIESKNTEVLHKLHSQTRQLNI